MQRFSKLFKVTTSVLLSSLLIFSCTQQDIPPADNPGTDVDVQIESISILPASATLEKGKTLQLTYEIQPSNIKKMALYGHLPTLL